MTIQTDQNLLLQKLYIMATGSLANSSEMAQFNGLYSSTGGPAKIDALVDTYIGKMITDRGMAATVKAIAVNGFGIALTDLQTTQLVNSLATAGITTGSKMLAFGSRIQGNLGSTLDNRGHAASDFLDTLSAAGKSSAFTGHGMTDAVQTLLQNIGSTPSSFANATSGFNALAANLSATGITGTADDYLAGATVFADTNRDGKLNAGEWSTTTNANGTYELPNATAGDKIIVYGGTDLMTGNAFKGLLSSFTGTTVVNPFTTVIEAMVTSRQVATVFDATTVIKSTLGLPTNINLLSYNPLAVLASLTSTDAEKAVALNIQATAQQISNIITQISAVIDNATIGATLQSAAAAVTLIISQAIANGTLHLANAADLVNVIQSAFTITGTAATTTQVAQIAQITAGSNFTAATATSFTMLAQAGDVAQGSATNALIAAALAGSYDAAVTGFTGTPLVLANYNTTVGSIAPGVLAPPTVSQVIEAAAAAAAAAALEAARLAALAAPTAALSYSKDGGATTATTLIVKDANTLQITATFSKPVTDGTPTITINNGVLPVTAMTKIDSTHYVYNLDVPAGDIAAATVLIGGAHDVTSNTISAVPTNAVFTVDNTGAAAATGIILTAIGGTVVANTLNATNTNLLASANILAGQATGGSAVLKIGSIAVATDTSIAAGDTSVTFNLGLNSAAALQAAIAAGGVATVTLTDATGNSTVSAVSNPTLVVAYTPPTAPTGVILGSSGGTAVPNSLNNTNTNLTAVASITAGDATGGSAVLKIGTTTVATDSTIGAADTKVTFNLGLVDNAALQEAVAAGGVATVTLINAAGNSAVSTLANPVLVVDYLPSFINLTTANDRVNGSTGNDTFFGTYGNGAGPYTFNSGDVLDGLAGKGDALIITTGAEASTPPDALWLNKPNFEKVVLNSLGNGAQSLTSGPNFQAAFAANGVDLTVQTLLGAIDVALTSFTGAAAISTTSIGAGAQTITTGSGISTVTAVGQAAGAQTINGAGLATVTATINGAGNQVIGTAAGGNLVSVSATIVGAGSQTIASTSNNAVTVVANATAGTQTITTAGGNDNVTSTGAAGQTATIDTGAGNDVIKAGLSNDLIIGGTGADTMTGGGGVDTFQFNADGSVIGTAMDVITDFNVAGADVIKFGIATPIILNADTSTMLPGSNVNTSATGLISFAATDTTLAQKIAAVEADAQLDVAKSIAMFTDSGNTYVYYAGPASGNADDQLIKLAGISTLTSIGAVVTGAISENDAAALAAAAAAEEAARLAGLVAPTASLSYSKDAGVTTATTASVQDANTLRITATFNKPVTDGTPTIFINNSVLAVTTMTKTDSTHYFYDLNVPAGDINTATVIIGGAHDATSNTISGTPTNAVFAIDNTAPQAATGLSLTARGGTVLTNTLNSTNTNMTAVATIAVGEATGGSAVLKVGTTTIATDSSITSGDTLLTFNLGLASTAALQTAVAAGGVATVTLIDAAGNSTVSTVANPTLTVDYSPPTAPSGITLTPVGGVVIADSLNNTNTNLTAVANITAGEATGGSAVLKVGTVSIATDAVIGASDTTVTFNLSTASNAALQAAVAAGGVATVTLLDVAGNAVVSSAANPTLSVDYVTGFITLTTANDTISGTAGNDIYFGTYGNGAGPYTFNSGDVLNGLAGTSDTLKITTGAEASTPPDALWTNLSNFEKVIFESTGSGAQSITSGTNFDKAFKANGVDLSAQTLLGAIDVALNTFTGAAVIHTTAIGAGAQTITTGSGASTVTATGQGAGAQTINGVGLATVTATIQGAGNQIIGTTSGGNLVSVNATIVGAGTQTITSTSNNAVTVVANAAAGTQTITTAGGNDNVTSIGAAGQTATIDTGAGNDVIKAGLSTDLIIGGTGADTMTGGGGVDTFQFNADGSVIGTAMDVITDFNVAGADVIKFGTTVPIILNADATALVAGSNVNTSATGLITFAATDTTLAQKIAAVEADTQLDVARSVAMFTDSGHSYVYYAGASPGNADDQLIKLADITSVTSVVTLVPAAVTEAALAEEARLAALAAPTASLTYSKDAGVTNTTTASAQDANTLRITATFSKPVSDGTPTITINNGILGVTAMTKTDSTHYFYNLDVPAGDVAAATVTIGGAHDTTSNTITDAPTNAVFAVDNTAPSAPTVVALTAVGGTVVANTLNTTNTNMTASATITAGQATGGSAVLKIGATTLATDSSIAAGDTSVTFSLGVATTAALQAAVAAGGVATVTLNDAAGNNSVSAVGNPTLVVDYTAPSAARVITLTPVGGTVMPNSLNSSNTNLTATATITAGQATGGSAILKIGTTTIATDAAIAGGDTTVTFDLGTASNAALKAIVASGGVATVTLLDAAGNPVVSSVSNPTLSVDYVAAFTDLVVGADNLLGTGANDTFNGNYGNGAPGARSFNAGDIINGAGGTDTLNITTAAEASTPPDGLWLNVSNIEKVILNSLGNGAQVMTSGTNFDNAFKTNGVDLSVQTLLGAIDVTLTSFTGAATIKTTTIGAGAHTIMTGSGVSTVTATGQADGAQTINGAGLTTVTATINNAGDQVIGTTSSGNLVTVTASIGGAGAQTITSTSNSNVTIVADAFSGAQTITTAGGNDSVTLTGAAGQSGLISTGSGNDVIKSGLSTDTITGGTGADTMTGGGGVDRFEFSTDGSIIGTSMDKITDFNTAGADVLKFGLGTTVLLTADATLLIAGSNVNTSGGGLITFATADNTFALKVAAIQADAQLDAIGSVAMFVDGGNTYVYYAGPAIGNADDQLIELTGITTLTTIIGGATMVIS